MPPSSLQQGLPARSSEGPGPIIALRFWWPHLEREERLDRLAAFVERNREGLDEIVLFTESIHGYLALEELSKRIPALRRALDRFRSLGFRVGLDLLNTIGHSDESPGLLPPMGLPPMVGLTGEVARSAACPRSAPFLDATAERYRLAAELGPDFIWIDDDLRLQWHFPVKHGCFCAECLASFNARNRSHHSLEELHRALKEDHWPAENPVRKELFAWNSEAIDAILSRIERAVHQVSPRIEVGLMQGRSPYSGADLGRWLNTLRGPERTPVRFRPGGGLHSEEQPRMIVSKALSLPPDISDRSIQIASLQAEIENFPYCPPEKPPRATMLEATCYLATGCDGALFNLLADSACSLEEFEPYFGEMRAWLPFWRQVSRLWRGMPLAGLWEALDIHGEARAVSQGDWPNSLHYRKVSALLSQSGLPMAVFPEGARGSVLTGSNVTTLEPRQLERLLNHGAIVDGEALTHLWAAGLGELTGVKIEKTWAEGVMEQYAEHPFNGPYAGEFRDGRTSFYRQFGEARVDYTLTPLNGDVAPLSLLVSQDERCLHGICAAVCENPSGGRVVTLGYRPWDNFQRLAKRFQYAKIARWVSHEALPLWVETHSSVTPFVRQSNPGSPLIALLVNPSQQPHSAVHVGLAHRFDTISLLRPFRLQEQSLAVEETDLGYSVEIPDMMGWDCAALWCR